MKKNQSLTDPPFVPPCGGAVRCVARVSHTGASERMTVVSLTGATTVSNATAAGSFVRCDAGPATPDGCAGAGGAVSEPFDTSAPDAGLFSGPPFYEHP